MIASNSGSKNSDCKERNRQIGCVNVVGLGCQKIYIYFLYIYCIYIHIPFILPLLNGSFISVTTSWFGALCLLPVFCIQPSRSLVVSLWLMLHPWVRSTLGYFLLMVIFFPGRRRAFMEELKGEEEIHWSRDQRRGESFYKDPFFLIQTSVENRASLFYSMCHWVAVVCVSLHLKKKKPSEVNRGVSSNLRSRYLANVFKWAWCGAQVAVALCLCPLCGTAVKSRNKGLQPPTYYRMQLPHFQSLPLNNTNEVHDFLFNQKKQKYHFKCKLFSNAAALANQPKLLCIFFWLVTTWAHHLDCIRRLTSIKCKASRVVYDWNRINRHILCICEWAGNISIQPAFFEWLKIQSVRPIRPALRCLSLPTYETNNKRRRSLRCTPTSFSSVDACSSVTFGSENPDADDVHQPQPHWAADLCSPLIWTKCLAFFGRVVIIWMKSMFSFCVKLCRLKWLILSKWN